MKGKTKASFFHTSCVKDSREVMDEVDGKKFVENVFKLNKIDESQARKSSELEPNVSCKVDVDGMVNCEEDEEDHESESSEVADNNIDLKNLVEVSKKGDKDEEMSSKDLSGVEDNNTCFVEMTTEVANIRVSVTNVQYDKAYRLLENQDNKEDDGVKCNEDVRDLVNVVPGMEIDSRRNGNSNYDAIGADDVVINSSKEDVNSNFKEVKNRKKHDGKDNEVKSSGVVINNFGLKVLDIPCEEKVEGIGMKSIEFFELDAKNMSIMSFDSSKDADTGEEISKDIKIDSNSWVACDSRCEESKIINGRMIQYDSKFEVPPDVDPKSIVCEFFKAGPMSVKFANAYNKCPKRREAEENSDINDVKLYHLRRWIKDLGKETKGFTHVVCQFDMWKWPTRKKIDGTQCKVKLRKWKFDTWKWLKRKKERRKESYVKLMFWYEYLYKEFGLEYCRKWAVVLLFMFDAVVDGSSKIRRGNELKTKFAREGFKYEMGDWVYLKLQTYMQCVKDNVVADATLV
ncbi:hypothetical protein Tco_1272904 [Tanacetum coccineum]